MRLPLKVLLDTNMLMLPAQINIDIFDGISEVLNANYEPITLSACVKELLRLMNEGSFSERRCASLALKLVELRCKVVDFGGIEVDKAIVSYARERGCVVATNDRELRKVLRAHGIPVIYLREGKVALEMEGEVFNGVPSGH